MEKTAAQSAVVLVGKAGQERRSLKVEAYTKIKSFLFDDDVHERVYSERQLATWLDIGLGSVRAAVERLRAEGLIAVLPNSGIRVPELTAHMVIDFYELRSVIESHVVASLAGQLSRSQIGQVESILLKQQQYVEEIRTEDYYDIDMAFHITLAEFHGNREIARTLGQMRDKCYRLQRRLHKTRPEWLAGNVEQHRAIWHAIRDGDSAGAMGALQGHLRWGRMCALDPTLRGVKRGDTGWSLD
jgi:DNA-binding GntR family transcriptional regulator